jgi:hypothetical protein
MSPLCHAILDELNTHVIVSGISRENQRVDIAAYSGLKTTELCEMSFPCLSSRQERPNVCGLGYGLGAGSARGVERSGLLTQEQSHPIPFPGEMD